jgi:hypothetical protein
MPIKSAEQARKVKKKVFKAQYLLSLKNLFNGHRENHSLEPITTISNLAA